MTEVEYASTMLVLPQDATRTQLDEIFDAAYPQRRTFGFSHDDAGNLNGTAVLYNIPDDAKQAYLDYYAEHYPRVTVTWAYTSDWEDNGDDPTPTDRQTRGNVGLHLQGNADGVDEFVSRVQPAVMKCVFGFERAYRIKAASPHTAVVLRHCENHSDPYVNHADGPLAGARAWIDLFRDSLVSIATELHSRYPDQDPVIYVESVNETIATGADNSPTYTFDEAFCTAIREMGLPIGPVVFTAAVGNPGEDEYADLVPVARACAKAKGMMGYHNYWLANPSYGGPDHLWQYLAGRWTEMDKVFVEHGVYVRWYGGESGVVAGESGDDASIQSLVRAWAIDKRMQEMDDEEDDLEWVYMDAFNGWKSNKCLSGDWDKYLAQIMRLDALTLEWNKAHGDRFLGSVLFTTSGPGWDSFDIGTDEIRGIGDALLERYGT